MPILLQAQNFNSSEASFRTTSGNETLIFTGRLLIRILIFPDSVSPDSDVTTALKV